ncbi:MAG: hypothetical protein OXF50_14970 [Caldilineaceae bacterium]|nr:hypothetical protein [Caldilineaceae bacterium]MDE0077567.1 hypothetical protein [Caldilineaceae bacterium]
MKRPQTIKQSPAALLMKSPRFRQLGIVSAVFLLILLASAAVLVFRAYSEGEEIREYVGGPFSSQLLYLQGCTAGAADNGGQSATGQTVEDQIRICRETAGSRAGYYVYDFNIGRSVVLSARDMELWREYAVLSFPESLRGRVRNSETNEFNRIVPFEEFTGFDYDCVLTKGENEASCKVADASCELGSDAIRCTVFNPHTESSELHVIERDKALDLLLPQGFINGPDLYKMLKPRFFPVLER